MNLDARVCERLAARCKDGYDDDLKRSESGDDFTRSESVDDLTRSESGDWCVGLGGVARRAGRADAVCLGFRSAPFTLAGEGACLGAACLPRTSLGAAVIDYTGGGVTV